MITKVLLAYDGSDNARRALDVASNLAVRFDADLTILHVLMHGRPAEELVRMAEVEHMAERVQQDLQHAITYAGGRAFDLFSPSDDLVGTQRIIAAVGDRLLAFAKARAEEIGVGHVEIMSRNGDYADQILDAASDHGADTIVIGSRGLGKIRGTVLGSVSQKVTHHADQIVVVVK